MKNLFGKTYAKAHYHWWEVSEESNRTEYALG